MSTRTRTTLSVSLLFLLPLLSASSILVSVMSNGEKSDAYRERTRSGSGVQKDEPHLAIAASTDKSVYKAGERISLKVSLINVGGQPVFLYSYLSWGMSSSLSLRVEDALGREVEPEGLDDSLTPPPALDKALFVKLNPRHFFGTTRELHLDEQNMGPGKYRMRVMYHSPIPDNFRQGLPIWSREKGAIESNPLEIFVR